MIDVLARLLIGHVVADYFLQPQWMAEGKSAPGRRGLVISLAHAAVYTFCVALLLWSWSPLALALIFLSHWPVDRYGMAGWWCRNVLSRHFADVSRQPAPDFDSKIIRTSFSTLVYVVVDNATHLILLVGLIELGLI